MRYLRLPAALPYFLGGLEISGGLALIGAVVAEFVAGTGGSASGLAYRILESGYRLQIPRMFAALLMISLSGIAIFFLTSWIAHLRCATGTKARCGEKTRMSLLVDQTHVRRDHMPAVGKAHPGLHLPPDLARHGLAPEQRRGDRRSRGRRW